jgi:hypothetical protein
LGFETGQSGLKRARIVSMLRPEFVILAGERGNKLLLTIQLV